MVYTILYTAQKTIEIVTWSHDFQLCKTIGENYTLSP